MAAVLTEILPMWRMFLSRNTETRRPLGKGGVCCAHLGVPLPSLLPNVSWGEWNATWSEHGAGPCQVADQHGGMQVRWVPTHTSCIRSRSICVCVRERGCVCVHCTLLTPHGCHIDRACRARVMLLQTAGHCVAVAAVYQYMPAVWTPTATH
jgi:hypothetical protein